MADAAGLLETIKRASKEVNESMKPVNVCFGKVISKSPLQISVEQKMVLGEEQLVLTRNVTDYMTTVTVQWETDKDTVWHRHKESSGDDTEYAGAVHAHSMAGTKSFLIHNALEKGDEVILVRRQEGQQYIVIDRIGGR